MRALIIDEDVKQRICKVIEYATAHPTLLKDIQATISGIKKAVGDTTPELVVNLLQGFKVVFSLEEQPMGLCRHLSISVEGLGYPNPGHCNEILKHFGFVNQIGSKGEKPMHMWMEEKVRAMNFLEPI